VGVLLPLEGASAGKLELLVSAGERAELVVEAWDTGRAENYVPAEFKSSAKVTVEEGDRQWVAIPVEREGVGESGSNIFVILRANAKISLFKSAVPLTGVLAFERGVLSKVSSDLEDHQPDQPIVEWSMKRLVRQPFCIAFETEAYSAGKVIDGYARPYGGPHSWASEPMAKERSEWVEVRLAELAAVSEIHLTFNDDVNEDLINLHHHETPFAIIPELVKDYDLEAWVGGEWRKLAQEQGNRKRKKVHRLTESVATDRVRLVVHATNGCERAELIELRVY
jgi:hypothetical protein